MSRIGKRPIVIPKGVTVKKEGSALTVKGPKGELKRDFVNYTKISLEVANDSITVQRKNTELDSSMEQGLIRALVANMVHGCEHGYTKVLDVVGVGYKADLKGKVLNLALGFSHPVDFNIPNGITVTVDKQTRITITGADKQVVGEVAASIRRIRPPEPYKGKGVRYADEVVRRKVGKAAGTTSGG